MCGISGYINSNNIDDWQKIIGKMCDTIKHRGPDDSGEWCDQETGLILGHRRLSILDLTDAGHQPMISHSGRYIIAFNGEIYNHLDIRSKLESNNKFNNWHGHSDTETFLASIDFWGLEEALKKSIGMFAFALWDRKDKSLYLARDRMGEKPLYYGWQKGVFMFASELKALKTHPSFTGEINRNALALYMRHNYVPAPYSIYNNIQKLLPGHFLKLNLNDQKNKSLPDSKAYWSLVEEANKGALNPYIGSDEQAITDLDNLLKNSVKKQMISDVPLGAFLSGGVDSSIIVALMQAQSSRPVKTFTIGFHEGGYNEATYAKSIAKYLGTDHNELYITSGQAMDVIPKIPSYYDEPFADSSQIPTFLVSQLAKHHVTVSLSGDAGDELFSGYTRYNMTNNIWNKLNNTPMSLRNAAKWFMTKTPPEVWNEIARRLPKFKKYGNIGDKIHKGAYLMTSRNIEELYMGFVTYWPSPENVVLNSFEPPSFLTGNKPSIRNIGDIEKMMVLDGITYLPDNILVKVDRAAMAVSLESRVPFLDHRVVEFAWQLPFNMKFRCGQGKWLLRQLLFNYIPKEFVDRPKTGFGVPIDKWLRGPLRDWAETLIDETRLKDEGYFNPNPIRKKWDERLTSKINWHHQIWGVLMFQAWLEQEKNI